MINTTDGFSSTRVVAAHPQIDHNSVDSVSATTRRNNKRTVVGIADVSSIDQRLSRDQSQASNKKLINMVRRRPWLYDGAHQDYAKKDIVEKTWKLIGRSCNDSAASCKERWRNIRAAFARSINLYKTQSGPNRVKPYYLHQELKFLIAPMTKGRKSQVVSNGLESPLNSITDENEVISSSDDEIIGKKVQENHIVQAPAVPGRELEQEEEENYNDVDMLENIAVASTNSDEMIVVPPSNTEENSHARHFTNSLRSIKRPKLQKFEDHPDNSTILFVKSLFYDMQPLNATQKFQLKKLIYEALEAFSSQSDQSTVVLQLVQTTMKTTAAHSETVPSTTSKQSPSPSSSSSSSAAATTAETPPRPSCATIPHSLTPIQKHIMTHISSLGESQLQNLDNYIGNILMPQTNVIPSSSSPTSSCITANAFTASNITLCSLNEKIVTTIKEEPLDDLINSNFPIQ